MEWVSHNVALSSITDSQRINLDDFQEVLSLPETEVTPAEA